MIVPKKRGFTLIEIIIVVSVILVVFTISFFGFKTIQPTLQLSGAARDLITDIRYVQQITLTEQLNYCVKLFPSEKKYQVLKCDGSKIVFEKILPSQITDFRILGFTNDTIEYNPYGAVKESGTIILENNINKTKTIEIRPSGFVKIIE